MKRRCVVLWWRSWKTTRHCAFGWKIKKNRLKRGIVLFPKIKDDDKNDVICFKQIERTLQIAFDTDQQQIIELKYLGNEKVKDSYVYNELMMRRDNFYENKKVAIRLIATALGLYKKRHYKSAFFKNFTLY